MKKIFLSAVFFVCLASIHAQKAKVQTAFNYLNYDQLDKAKAAIDEAAANEQSMKMEKTWYYRGMIYHRMYKHEKYGSLEPQCLQKAYEYYQKSLELNPQSDYVDSIRVYKMSVIYSLYGLGVEQFNEKNYSGALETFESVIRFNPNDTLSMLNAAYAAEKSGNKTKAKQYYSGLIEMKYHDAKVFIFLSNILKQEQDSSEAIKVIQAGRKIFPHDNNLVIEEVNYNLYSGKCKEATENLTLAISKDESNASLYLARGNCYDKLNESDKAKADYLKAIELKPDFFDANYNLGAMLFNQGADLVNKANAIPPNKQKEFEEAKKKADTKFKEAQPYLEKALELIPDDRNTLISLKQLYARLGDTVKYEKVKAALDKK